MNAQQPESADLSLFPRLVEALEGHMERFPYGLLDGYERLVVDIEAKWGTMDCILLLDDLLMPNRPGRVGFPTALFAEITWLKQCHEHLYPDVSVSPHDPFSRLPSSDLLRIEDVSRESPSVSVVEEEEPFQEWSVCEKVVDWGVVHDVEQLSLALVQRKTTGRAWVRLGEILINKGVLSEDQLKSALFRQEQRDISSVDDQGEKDLESIRLPIGQIFRREGWISEAVLTYALCHQVGIPLIGEGFKPSLPPSVKKVPQDVLLQREAVPLAVMDDSLIVGVRDPLVYPERAFLQFIWNMPVELVCIEPDRLKRLILQKGFGGESSLPSLPLDARLADSEFRSLAQKAMEAFGGHALSEDNELPDISENDSTVVGLVNRMITNAIDSRTSDIHLEAFPGQHSTRIRFRQDGELHDFSEFPVAYHPAVVSRIKIMAGLDISERRRPQDGKISFPRAGGKRIDLRVATLPGVRGVEFVTIRILASGEPIPLDKIGMSSRDMAAFRSEIARPYGLVLVCGPTGSGKTTTLHSALRELNTPNRKIWTIEDPIEIVQPNLCQVQVQAKIGLDFEAALRSFLRADPDVIMVGEMRDPPTAKMALEASMTGHLVLSTLHTNSSAETAARLIDLGVDHYNLSDALRCILAQRLARRLCISCAKSHVFSRKELEDLAAEYHFAGVGKLPGSSDRDRILSVWRKQLGAGGDLVGKRPIGCPECNHSGFRGRFGIYELLVSSHHIRDLIRQRAPALDFVAQGVREGMKTLKQDGIEKVLQGVSTLAEVRQACI